MKNSAASTTKSSWAPPCSALPPHRRSSRWPMDAASSSSGGPNHVRSISPCHSSSRARIEGNEDGDPTWGRDTTPWMAYIKSAAEAVERQGFREPSHLVFGKIDSVPNAIPPDGFLRYSKTQLNSPSFPFQAFDANHSYAWVTGVRQSTGEQVRVVSDLVHPRQSVRHEGVLGQSLPLRPLPDAQHTRTGMRPKRGRHSN